MTGMAAPQPLTWRLIPIETRVVVPGEGAGVVGGYQMVDGRQRLLVRLDGGNTVARAWADEVRKLPADGPPAPGAGSPASGGAAHRAAAAAAATSPTSHPDGVAAARVPSPGRPLP